MALLGANLQIGRSALATYQSALSVTGQNIANLANPEYTRQSARLEALRGGITPSGFDPGAGVRLNALVRHLDNAIEGRLRTSLSSRNGAETTQRALLQTEALYNEFTDADLSTAFAELFGQFGTLQINPQDSASRGLIRSNAESIVNEFRRLRSGLVDQVEDLNVSVQQAVSRADQIAAEIANLNELIVVEESRATGGASPLRDRRDGLLRELSEYMDIQVRETSNGAVNVYVNSDPLVDFNRSRGLSTQLELQDGLEIFTVRFTDDNGLIRFNDGLLAGVVHTRDRAIRGQLADLDQLANGFIYEVNRLHSTGVGLQAYEQLLGSNAVLDATAPLGAPAAGLPYPVTNGVMIVHVRDADTGQEITRQIEVDLDGLNGDDTSLAALVNDLDEVPGLTVTVTADRRLSIVADPGQQVWFSEDSSGALAALGVGSFFDGTDALTIDLNDQIRNNTNLIAASGNGAAADGANAGKLALLQNAASGLLGSRTVQQFHGDMFNNVAVQAAGAQVRFDAADAVYFSMLAQRESVSGVSLDEEAINLTKFQTAYQGAARYVDVVQQLTTELLGILN